MAKTTDFRGSLNFDSPEFYSMAMSSLNCIDNVSAPGKLENVMRFPSHATSIFMYSCTDCMSTNITYGRAINRE